MQSPEKNKEQMQPEGGRGPAPEIKLPFGKKEQEPGEWIYEHRVAVFITVIIYLVFAIIFVFSKIVVNKVDAQNRIVVDLSELDRLKEELAKAEELNRRLNEAAPDEYFNDVRNIVSNENAAVEELHQNDQHVQDQLRETREMFEKAQQELQMMEQQQARQEEDAAAGKDARVEGRVTVSFSLSNPTRTAANLFVPAYRCEAGGKVVVGITVNPNGDVIAASVVKNLSSSDYCMVTTALDAAERSRFNVHPAAPAKQTGTITYIFVPQ